MATTESTAGSTTRAAQTERTREAIVDVVVSLIEEQGHFTIAEVAQRSGISPATIYRHYPDRTALIEAVARVDQYRPDVVPQTLAEWRELIIDIWKWQEENFDRIFAISATPTGRQMRATRMRDREPFLSNRIESMGIDPESAAGRRLLLLWHTVASSRAFIDFHEVFDLDATEAAEMVGWAVTALFRATQEGWEIGDGLD